MHLKTLQSYSEQSVRLYFLFRLQRNKIVGVPEHLCEESVKSRFSSSGTFQIPALDKHRISCVQTELRPDGMRQDEPLFINIGDRAKLTSCVSFNKFRK